MQESIFIPGNVPSLKNSKIKTSRGIFPSKTVVKYLRNLGIQQYSLRRKEIKGYKIRPNLFEEFRSDWFKLTGEGRPNPIVVGIHFVRGSKHKFDFHNATQIIADLLVAHDFIDDDDMDNFIPIPLKHKGLWYSYDKDNPGVYLRVLK
jgi:hypothetical protein